MIKILLTLIIILFLFLSFYGIKADLPYSRVATEIEQVRFAVKFGSGDLNPHHFIHPPFFAYVLFSFYVIIFLFGKAVGIFKTILDYQRLYFTDPTIFYIVARSVILILAGLSIVTLYSIGKRLFDKKIALVACLFMAFSPVYIKWAHYASTDVPMLFLSLSSFYFIVRILKGGSWWDYILAGFLAGLAIATKYNAGLLIIPILIAHFISPQQKTSLKKILNKRLIVALLCLLLGFLLGCPFALLDYNTFLPEFFKQSQRMTDQNYHFPTWRINKPGWVYILTDALPFGLGIPLTILVIFGIFYSFYRHRKQDFLLLSLILISYIIVGNWDIIKPRYLIHVFPFMLLLGSRFLVEIVSNLKISDRRCTALIAAISILLIIMPFYHVMKFDNLVSQEPVAIETKEWVEKHIPPGSKIATFTGIPLVPNSGSLKRKLKEVKEKKIGKGVELEKMLEHSHLFKISYEIIELPYPWREDYEDEDFDFARQIKGGIVYFIFTQEVMEYLAYPIKYKTQVDYYNSVKKNCILIKEFRRQRPKIEPGYISGEEYVQIYQYKNS